MTRLDSLGMYEAALALPEQVANAAISVAGGIDGLPAREQVAHVLALGMGGSGIAGDVMSVVAGPFVPVPILVSKDYELPGFVGERTLVFAISFSGNSEETVEAATQAAALGARVVAVCEGGELARLAEQWGGAVLRVPPRHPDAPRGHRRVVDPSAARARADGPVSRSGGWISAAVDQLAAPPRSACGSEQRRRPACARHRSHHPAVLRRRTTRRGGCAAVEGRCQREREGAGVCQPCSRAVSQRGRGMGPAR